MVKVYLFNNQKTTTDPSKITRANKLKALPKEET
jgi:hypothetical protein